MLLSEEADDLPELRRRLAVAGSIGGRHLAAIVDVHAGGGRAVLVLAPPGGPSLAHLRTSRGTLRAGEIVTLIAPLATTIATLHSRGLELGDVVPATVWLTAEGRPLLLPAIVRDRSDAGGADLGRLARLALDLLDPGSLGADELSSVLRAAVDGEIDAVGLGPALLRSVRAQPIELVRPVGPQARQRRRGRLRLQPVALVVGVAAVAVGLGGLWGRHDGSAVLAAPPRVATDGSPSARVPPWLAVMTELEQARARAYAVGDTEALDNVYAPGSPTRKADRALLGRMVRHREHAAGLQAFVESVDVLTATDTSATLRISDALTAYDVVTTDGQVVRHGQGRPSTTWLVELQKTTAGWRISSISRAPIHATASTCPRRARC